MHSDGNISFCGDVVLDGFNMVYNDEDSISDQTYKKQIFLDFYFEDLSIIEENSYLKKYSTLQQGTHKIGF